MFAFERYRWKNIPFGLIFCVIALSILGYMVLGSAVINDSTGADTLNKQLIGFAVGGVGMVLIGLIDYHFWIRLYPLVYLAMIGILGLLYTPLGATYNKATRWIEISNVGQLQPSEFAKILMIVFFAWFFEKVQAKMNKFKYVLLAVALIVPPAFIIFKEPDLSSTLLFLCAFLAIFFAAGLSYKWIGVACGLMVPAGLFLIWDSMQENPLILKEYMLNRIMTFLHPEEYGSTGLNDQQNQAVLAISSGRLHGKGLYNASFESVKNGHFLSEENCDFIFAVIGEEMGFWGALAVIGLFFLLVIFCFSIAGRARDTSGKLICVGVGSLIGLEAFVNIGVTSGLLPNTGIALPLFSAGLSSLVTTLFGIGFVINVALQRRENDERY